MSITTASLDSLPRVDLPASDATEPPVALREEASAPPAGHPRTSADAANMRGKPLGRATLRRPAAALALLAGDGLAMLIAAIALWALGAIPPTATQAPAFLAFAAVLALAQFAFAGLYPGYGIYDHEQIRRRAVGSVRTGLAVMPPLVFFGATSTIVPVLLFLALMLCIQPATQHLARRTARALGLWGECVALFGPTDQAEEIAGYFRRHWQLGIVADISGDRQSRHGVARLACLTSPICLSLHQVSELRDSFAEIVLLADAPSLKISGVQPSDVGGTIGLVLARGRSSTAAGMGRRLLDLAIALPAAMLAAPLVAIAAAAIYAVDPGPVFFRQRREGLGGSPIEVLKLRTMYRDAEFRLEALFAARPEMRAEWQAHFKLKHDPRILPLVGRALRASSCDELPQLWNVIIGEMSIVGPRPFPDYHLAAMSSEFRDKRHTVMPGLTGLWQVSERSNAELDLQCQIDDFYIDNRSVWLDWHILLRTIPAVLGRGGAF